MHTRLKPINPLLIFIGIILTSINAEAQDDLNAYLRIGLNNLYSEANVNINNHEAYIIGNEIDMDQPLFYGLDIHAKINDKWLLKSRIDISTEYTLSFHNVTNKYVFSDNLLVEEIVEYDFAPIFFDFSIGRSFDVLKVTKVTPYAGIGGRSIGKKNTRTIYSNANPNQNQLALANQEFASSFDRFSTFWQAGAAIFYRKIYFDCTLRIPFSNSYANDFEFEGRNQPTEVDLTFISLSLGYKIWSQF